MSMAIVAIAGGVVSAGVQIASTVVQKNAADNASKTQAEAADKATALQKQQYNQTRDDFQPYRQAGSQALTQMQDADFQRDFGADDFQKDPGYDFRMGEAQKAIERSSAARGGLNSGRAMKDISRFSQGFASGEYQNAYNRFNSDRDRRFGRLQSVAGMGQASAAQTAAAGQNYANQGGQSMIGAGNAIAAGQIGSAAAISQGMNAVGQAGVSTAQNYGAASQQNKWMDRWLAKQGG